MAGSPQLETPMFFQGLRGLIPLKVQVPAPGEPVTRGCMAHEEEGDGFEGLQAVLTPLIPVSGQPFLPWGCAPVEHLLTPRAWPRRVTFSQHHSSEFQVGSGVMVSVLLLPGRVLSLSRTKHPGCAGGFPEGRTVLVVAREELLFFF